MRNLHNPSTAKSVQRIIGEAAFANVATHLSGRIVGREARKTHLLGLDQADHCAVSIVLAYRSRNDFLKIHLERPEKMLWKIGAVEAHRLIRIVGVVVVPVEQCRRSSRRELQS